LGQLHSLYLVCESPTGLILIDQHAAHERIVFERLKRQTELGKPQVQRLLFPEPLELSPLEWETLERYLPALSQIGLDLEPFGRNTLMIQSVPSILPGKDCARVVSDLIRDLVEEDARGGAAKPIETAIRLTACHGAIRAGRTLSHQEMLALVEEMEEEGFFSTCPHGRPACIEIDLPRLDKMFGRSS
jgi:DNA mismatch repair protein MutL